MEYFVSFYKMIIFPRILSERFSSSVKYHELSRFDQLTINHHYFSIIDKFGSMVKWNLNLHKSSK